MNDLINIDRRSTLEATMKTYDDPGLACSFKTYRYIACLKCMDCHKTLWQKLLRRIVFMISRITLFMFCKIEALWVSWIMDHLWPYVPNVIHIIHAAINLFLNWLIKY